MVTINLIHYDRQGDASLTDPRPVKWVTNEGPLHGPSGSRYGGAYEFVGIDTMDGGLSVTLRFSDVAALASFRELMEGAEFISMTPDQHGRYQVFMDALEGAIQQAPRRTVSYHAGIDAIRGEDVDTPDDPDWPDAEEGVSPNA